MFPSVLLALLSIFLSPAIALTPGPEFIRLNKNDSVTLPSVVSLVKLYLLTTAGSRRRRPPGRSLSNCTHIHHIPEYPNPLTKHKVRDYDPTVFRNNMIAHAGIAKIFNIPIVLTTSAEHGPNGQLPKEITNMFPDAPFIRRNGEVDAWDNADFRAAVQATGKSQVILAGITTDVCE